MSQLSDSPGAVSPSRGHRTEQLNGFVIVVLDARARDIVVDDLRVLAAEAHLPELGALLDELGGPPTAPLIRGSQRADVIALERRARENNPERQRRSLLLFWHVDARKLEIRPEALALAFARLPGVETAYAKSVISETSGAVATQAATLTRSHLDAAPDGVDARWAWTRAGGGGTGVRLVDIEQAWRLTHPALVAAAPLVLPDPDKLRVNRDEIGGYVGDHGTAVLAVIAGADPGQGVVGMAPALESIAACSHYDAVDGEPLHVAAAVAQAAAALGPGGVLLLEVQRGGELTKLPTETQLADFEAIELATASGVIVVEAAGNGRTDLDAWTDPSTSTRKMQRGHPQFDSRAIMVGAAVAEVTEGGHARCPDSNWGERVDCYGWGEDVATATATGFQPSFGGTSAASAIIAGVAVLTQAMHLGAHPAALPLTPEQMRALLSDPTNGTPQTDPGRGKLIGSMPDLRRIGQAVGATPAS